MRKHKILYLIVGAITVLALVVFAYSKEHGALTHYDNVGDIIESSLRALDKYDYYLRSADVITDATADVSFEILNDDYKISTYKICEGKRDNSYSYSYSSDTADWIEYISFENDGWCSYVHDSVSGSYVRCLVDDVDILDTSHIVKDIASGTLYTEEEIEWDGDKCYIIEQQYSYDDESFSYERYYISQKSLLLLGSIVMHYTPTDIPSTADGNEEGTKIEGVQYKASIVRTTYSYSNESLHLMNKPEEYITEEEYKLNKEGN